MIPGFYTSHDGEHQIIRLMHFHQGLIDGQFPVRWAGTALKGYGYPLFIFTYRLPFYIAEMCYLIFPNLANAIKLTFVITYILSGLALFWLANNLFKDKLAGFLSAVLYLWAPYRFVNIFVRASLGEATTFIFIPLIFLGIYKIYKNKNILKWQILTGLFLAGLILSHAMIVFLWLIPLFLWVGLNYFLAKHKKDYIIALLTSGFISLLLSAFYWLPAMVERKYIQFSNALGDYYKSHFVSLKQLIYSKWEYGFSMPGIENDMMSFQVGIAQWLAVLMIVLIITWYFAGKKISFLNKCFKQVIDVKNTNFFYLIYFLFIFLLSLYLMLPQSSWFYKLIARFQTIDLPWRFLGISVFSSSILAGFAYKTIKHKLLAIMFIIFMLFLAFYTNRNHLRVNKYIFTPESEYLKSTETSNEHEDYTPKDFMSVAFKSNDPDLITQSGKSTNKLLLRTSKLFRFYSEVKSKNAEIITKLAYYPGWEAFIDNKKAKIEQDGGRIRIKLSKGNHLITLRFQETRLRRLSNWLSFLTLTGIILFSLKYGQKKD